MKPYPCACGCKRMIKPVRLDQRGNFSEAKYFSSECRDRQRSKQMKKRRVVRTDETDGRWKIHPIVDKFIYAKPRTA